MLKSANMKNTEPRPKFTGSLKKIVYINGINFQGRSFCDFVNFLDVRESLYPRTRRFMVTRKMVKIRNIFRIFSQYFLPAKDVPTK